MKIPKTLKVRGKRWTVQFKQLPPMQLGECNYTKRVIYLDPDQLPNKDDLDDTFMHEVIHACLPEAWETEMEERLVEVLAPRLLETLRGLGWVS